MLKQFGGVSEGIAVDAQWRVFMFWYYHLKYVNQKLLMIVFFEPVKN